jgi:hypothetical protein
MGCPICNEPIWKVSSLHLTTTLIDIVRQVRTNYGTLPYLLHPPPNSRIPDFWIGDVISVCQHTPVKTGNQCAYNRAATTAIGCADSGTVLAGTARDVEPKSLQNHCV